VQRPEAGRQVTLVLVAEAVVFREELVVVVLETLAKPADLGISTSVTLPEPSYGLFIH
jgi:hypothetical protein